MKFVVTVLLIISLSFEVCFYHQWWTIAIVAFLVSVLIPQAPLRAFFAGFLALFLLWVVLAFWISTNNEHILAHRMSVVILKIDSPVLLVFITGLVGALVAGFASLAGSFLRKSK